MAEYYAHTHITVKRRPCARARVKAANARRLAHARFRNSSRDFYDFLIVIAYTLAKLPYSPRNDTAAAQKKGPSVFVPRAFFRVNFLPSERAYLLLRVHIWQLSFRLLFVPPPPPPLPSSPRQETLGIRSQSHILITRTRQSVYTRQRQRGTDSTRGRAGSN